MVNERHKLWLYLLSSALLLLWPRPSSAEMDEEARIEARRLFDEANRAFEEGLLSQARELLDQSLVVFAHPSTAYNLALVLQRIGATHRAVEVLEGLIEGRHGTPDSRQRREAEVLLEQIRHELASIVLRVEGPDDTEIRVDGVLVGTAGDAGVIEVSVDAGRHRVIATAPEHSPAEEVIEVNRGERAEVTISPSPHPGSLVLESDADTELEVPGFGRSLGALRLELPPGQYNAIARRGSRIREVPVELAPGQSLRVRVEPPTRGFWRHPATWVVFGSLVATAVGIGLWLGLRDDDEDPRIRWQVEAVESR